MRRGLTYLLLAAALALSSGAVAQGAGTDQVADAVRFREMAASAFGLLTAGKLIQAERAFHRLADAYPGGEPWYGLARVCVLQGRPREAMAYYDRLLPPVAPRAYELRFSWPGLGGMSDSIAVLEYAALLDRYGSAEQGLALYQSLIGQMGTPDALAEEPVVLPLRPTGADRSRLEALARVALGIRRTSVATQFPDASYRGQRDTALLESQASGALDEFRAAVKLDPQSGIAQFYLGRALYSVAASRAEAGRALDRAAALGGDDVRAAVRELRATGKVSPLRQEVAWQRHLDWVALTKEWSARQPDRP